MNAFFGLFFYHIYLIQKCTALTKNTREHLNGNVEDAILTITGKDVFFEFGNREMEEL